METSYQHSYMRITMEIRIFSSLLSFFLLAMAFIPCALATNITTDHSSLLSLKSYISLTNHHILAKNWSINTSVCSWIGVVCESRHHRVVALNISSMGLVGTLPPQLGNLSFLVSLNISYNRFYGNLPRELANLCQLQILDFGYNDFSGKIPEEIGNLRYAKSLILEVNQLDGPIPFTIFNISTLQNLVLNNNSLSSSLPMKLCQHATRLKVLRLYFNKLSGDIPKNLSGCSELEEFRLGHNNFVGTIPRDIGSLNMLHFLTLGNNNLEGKIPETIFNISSLTIISMRNNNLSGILPPNMCSHLQKLEELYLYQNKLYGNIPRSIGECYKLKYLYIGGNQLNGSLPRQIGNLTMLKKLNLAENSLSGIIPDTIFNISTLTFISMKNNSLSGVLPPNMCSRLQKIEELYLYQNTLYGNIPRSIGECYKLKYLYMGGNQLNGSLPRQIGNLTMLEKLNLAENSLSGIIPETIFNISSLTIISMGNNSLSGILPPNMCPHLQKVEELYLYQNKLYGNIPRSIGECYKLKYLYMGGNQLNGSLPRQIGNLTMLEKLNLAENSLSGIIPDTIFNISTLTYISMKNNSLSGILPPNMCSHFQKIEELYLYQNTLYGNIPRSIGECFKLKYLYMEENHLNGSLPRQIGNLTMLEKLDLAENSLSGTLPTSLGHWLPNLKELYLDNNYIGGVIPAQISNASNLLLLQLSQNQFSGFIPNSLGNLAKLKVLNLFENNLTTDPQFSLMNSLANCRYLQTLQLSHNPLNAVLPNAIRNLSTTLQIFHVSYCNIRGRIPQEIGNLSSLYKLSLWSNDIIGFLPTTVQALQNLQLLDISENRLKGSFPNVVCELQHLFWIRLGKNKFSGPISDCLWNVSSLRVIDLSENEFTVFPPTLWSHENLFWLDLHSNNLRGSLLQEIGNSKTAIHIDLSNNKLSGEIPSSIGGLTELMNFSVAHNTIQGSIPDTFGQLLDLHSLDLSDNQISGMIPKSLEGLVSLNYFNVSYNRLTGEIPSGGPFANFTYESFLANDGLCGTPRKHVPPCPANTLHASKNRVVFTVLVSLAVLIVLIASVSVFLIFKRHNKEVTHEPNLLSTTTPARFSYYELQQATNGFDESNSLGSGSFGSVYKGILANGMHVAVKVFRLKHEGENMSFNTECEVLRNIRHRNLTKVLGSCSNMSFKALLLEYMPNGCLHMWLHSQNYFLDMMQRVSIMIDVASALEYLHHGYSQPIIHCDLKPSNVLIDADMVGHLSDFGVAKLLGDGNSVAITNTLATIGYIAPEYGHEGLVSTRSDMYSYGIMLFEVFTKTQPGDEMFSEDLNLRSWVHNALPTNIGQIIDPNLLDPDEDKYNEKLECVAAIFELGLKCSTKSPRERMSIKDALPALKKIKVRLLPLYASN